MPSKHPSPSPRERKVLRHIGRYKITLRAALSHLFLEGRDPGNLVQALKDKKLILERSRAKGNGMPNGVSFYQLTAQGALAAGYEKERARELSNDIDPHESLAVLWSCCMNDRARRDRLEVSELRKLFAADQLPTPLWRHPCCRDQRGERPVLLQAYVPGLNTLLENRVRGVLRRLKAAKRVEGLAALMDSRSFGLLVLVDEPARRRALRDRIGKLGIQRWARVSIELAPSPCNAAPMLREWRSIRPQPEPQGEIQ